MKKSLLFFLLALLVTPAWAQDASSLIIKGKTDLHQAVNENSLNGIKEVKALLQRASQDKEVGHYAYYYLGLAEYRLASLDEENMADHIDQGIDYLEKMLKMDKGNVEGSALLGSLVGWKAGLKPMQAMFLGPKSNRLLNAATEADPENPRVMLFKSISDYNTPEQWGGDKDRAMEGFKKATTFFENRPAGDEIESSWGHPDAYAWLGIIHMGRDQNDEAKAAFEKALEIDPNFAWVKYGLMPQLASNE